MKTFHFYFTSKTKEKVEGVALWENEKVAFRFRIQSDYFECSAVADYKLTDTEYYKLQEHAKSVYDAFQEKSICCIALTA